MTLFYERRLAEIAVNPPKAPTVTFDELLEPPEAPEPDPLLPGRRSGPRHAR